MSEAATGTLFERISSREGLEGGWRMVLAKDASDGVLQRKTKEFAEHLDDFLTELSESLRSGTYEPDPLLSFGIPKGTSGEVRTLHIPSIRDRVVERAVVNAVAHRADLVMSPCSFAYRTGIGTDDAVDHLARLRDTGYRYVLRTDIEDYFPNLSIEDALAALSPIAGCPRTIDLIRLIARPRRARGERRTRNRGISQGSCLSPLLANLALTDVDRAMGDAGYGYARFADDIVICSPHEPDLLEALELLDSLLTPRGLRLNQEKTAMTSFDEGFCYLGTDFSRSFPPVAPRHDIKGRPDPDQVVYVGRDGARVHISQNRLIVDGADGLPQTSTNSWGWRAPPRQPTSAACPDWSHRRSPSTDAVAAHPRTWPTPPSPTPTRSCRPSARALCWPPDSRPRSGCCTPPPTSVAASPSATSAAGPPGRRAGGLGLPAPGVRFPAAAGARRTRRGAPTGHRDHQPGRRRHPPLPAVRLLPDTQRDPRDHARARRRRAVPRGMVSRQHVENARLTGVSHPACDDDRVLRDDQCRRPR